MRLARFRSGGYGSSQGSPSETALVADALRWYDELAPHYQTVYLLGRSLGSGVAVQLAAARPVSGVILVTPFDSMVEVGRRHYPFLPVSWMLRHRFDSIAAAPKISAPLLCLVATRDGHHRLALERGTLHALISAPPGQFVVNTPSATATDLGCAYTLHVDEEGAGYLSVTSGWVALALNQRESLVPVGASCRTDPKRGPGTPSYDDADPELKAAAVGGMSFRRADRHVADVLSTANDDTFDLIYRQSYLEEIDDKTVRARLAAARARAARPAPCRCACRPCR